MPYKYTPSHTVNQLIGVVGDVVRGDEGALNLLKVLALPILLFYGAGRDAGLWHQDESMYETFGESFDELYKVLSGFVGEQVSKSALKYRIEEYQEVFTNLNNDFLKMLKEAEKQINRIQTDPQKLSDKDLLSKFLTVESNNLYLNNLFTVADDLLKNYIVFIIFLIIIEVKNNSKNSKDFLRRLRNTNNEHQAFFQITDFISGSSSNVANLFYKLGKIVRNDRLNKVDFTYDMLYDSHNDHINPRVDESAKEAAKVKRLFKEHGGSAELSQAFDLFKKIIRGTESYKLQPNRYSLKAPLDELKQMLRIFPKIIRKVQPDMHYTENPTSNSTTYAAGEYRTFTNKGTFIEINKNTIRHFITILSGFTSTMLFCQGLFVTSLKSMQKVLNAK